MKKHLILTFLGAATIVASLIPVWRVAQVVGQKWQGIWPELTDDSLYYYSRIHEIKDGYPFLGNPYFFEHRNETPVSFFATDWLASIPLLAGWSLTTTIVFNLIAWSLALNILMYALLRRLGFSKTIAAVGCFLAYFAVYPLEFRPVAMQTVFPFFVTFLLSLLLWLKKPIDKLRTVFFALATSATFYIYSYLPQVVAITFFLILASLFLLKKIQAIKHLIAAGFAILLATFPVWWYTAGQLQNPDFWETMQRIGLVSSRLPTVSAFQYGLIILPVLFFWLVIRKRSVNSFYFIITGTSLLLAIFSNVLIGKELETANHVGRFVPFWLVPAAIEIFLTTRKIFKYIAIAALVLLVQRNSPSIMAILFPADTQNYIKIQTYAEPLRWLDERESEPKVVWSVGDVNQYIPMITKHYVLFHPLGGLHFMSSGELEERYLVANYLQRLSLADIERDFREYAGTGNAVHQYSFHNYRVRICRILYFPFASNNCGEITDAVSFKGERYFDNLLGKYLSWTGPDITQLLRKYHVNYLLVQNPLSQKARENLGGPKLVFNNNNFYIYEFNF